ncbi:hypothetical protein FRZ67_09535 [Panacibacter ginsenosidivorans]|uniref:DUF3300 domain-containing protein n=1 Tax=Panacibacter ginsenosidivorans TaxID=1813871 RepID=A0A5B8V8N6_9BACT|nr:DUF6515 family protein [Panacibacter ginsenosidivorans]QEC67525.1 hypothetical protein FRZ67_09535 [Panacibacter ginsenosidivorans]
MNRLFSAALLSILTIAAFSQPVSHRRVFVHPSTAPVVVHRAPVVVNRGPVVVNRSPVVVNRAPVIVSRPSVYYPYHGISYRFNCGYYYRPYGSYWRPAFPPIGLRVNFLPYGYMPMYVGPSLFYYNNGAYYRRYNDNSYEVVDPPMGATLSSLPGGAKRVTVNGEEFYELNGTYYKETTNEKGKTVYVVTGKHGEINNSVTPDSSEQNFIPQQGDIIDQLPDNCKTITLNGTTYYVSPDDIYYQSIDQDGTTRYEVVGKPDGNIQD